MMEDNRVRVSTIKTVNLAQLDIETGGHGLCGGENVVVAVEGSPLTKAELSEAIDAHVAVMPPTVEEIAAATADAVAHAKSLGFTDEMIRVMYPNLGV